MNKPVIAANADLQAGQSDHGSVAQLLAMDLGQERATKHLREAGALEAEVRAFAEADQVPLGQVAQPLRAALTGLKVSPGIFEVMATLGRDEVIGRLDDVTGA